MSILEAPRPRVTQSSFFASLWLDLLAHSPNYCTQPWWRKFLGIVYGLTLSSSFHMMLLYRIGNLFHHLHCRPVSLLVEKLIYHLYQCIIPCSVTIGPGVWFAHPLGIVFTKTARIGSRVYIFQHVQLISSHSSGDVYDDRIEIGDRSYLMTGATIIGSSVGEESMVAARAVVTKYVPPRHMAMGMPAVIKPLRKEQLAFLPSEFPGGPAWNCKRCGRNMLLTRPWAMDYFCGRR